MIQNPPSTRETLLEITSYVLLSHSFIFLSAQWLAGKNLLHLVGWCKFVFNPDKVFGILKSMYATVVCALATFPMVAWLLQKFLHYSHAILGEKSFNELQTSGTFTFPQVSKKIQSTAHAQPLVNRNLLAELLIPLRCSQLLL